MAETQTSFLDLPVEVRLQVYNLTLNPARLCTHAILDPEWLFTTTSPHCVSPLLFVSKQIYREVAPIFYSMATLEVTACQRGPSDSRQLDEFLQQYQSDHAFCRPENLQLIQNVHVYGDQSWPVDQDSFQALFQWLVTKTSARHVYLSRKTVQQSRHIPELVCLNNLAYDFTSQNGTMRIVDIYARNVSSRLRFMDGKNCLRNRAKPLPDVQLYLDFKDRVDSKLCREPRWEILTSSSTTAKKEDLLQEEMDRFANSHLTDTSFRQAHLDGYLWLYKTIQIERRVDRISRMSSCVDKGDLV